MSTLDPPRGTTLRMSSSNADPVEALRAALAELARTLTAQEVAFGQLTGMRWTASNPGAIHPSRRAVDLAYRDIFGGTRPPVTVARAAEDVVSIEATFIQAPPPEPGLARQMRSFSPRHEVPDVAALFAEWNTRGKAFLQAHTALDLAYGTAATETLDVYRPIGAARPPVWVFVHGGYWQAMTKTQHAQFMDGMLAAGFAVANIEYGHAPRDPIDKLVAQVRAAMAFLVREADALAIDVDRFHVAGHSAGAHLAAMVALDSTLPVRSVLLLSGLYDLAPLALLPMGELLKLGAPDAVHRLAPVAYPHPPNVRVGVAVGGAETDAFIEQSRIIAKAWGAPEPMLVPGANHFDLLEGLNGGALLDFALKTAGA